MGWKGSVCSRAGEVGKGRLDLLIATLTLGAIGLLLSAASAHALSPSVGSKAATNVGYSTATLNGTVNPNGLATKTYFEYGPTTSYGSKTSEVSVGSGSNAIERAQAVTGLTPNTTYHYRVVATNADGTSTGGDRTFHVGWTLQTVANQATAGVFHDVSCSSATECTAVGFSGAQAIAQRWNGSEWKTQTVPKPEGSTEAVLHGVSCPSSSACTAVGRYKNSSAKWVTLVEFWNGTEWKIQSTSSPVATAAVLYDVSCVSSSECTAAGYYGNSGPPETNQTLAMRWNGSEWKTQTTANIGSRSILSSVSCPTSTFCMATGEYEVSAGKWAPLSESWNGTAWSTQTAVKPFGATMSWFHDVSCTSSAACTAVGDKEVNATTKETQTMAQRWNGSSWSLQTTPNPVATDRDLEAISCTTATACTAIGYSTSSGVESPMALRWDGSAWTLRAPPLPSGSSKARAHGISCVTARGCQGVGQFTNASSVIVPLAVADWRKAAPSATTGAASGIAETSATLNGTVNPNGSETKLYFEYGKTTSYGSKTAEVNVGSGTGAVEKSEALTGLSPNTTYHYRVVANNENPETSRGSDQVFTTPGPPTVYTDAPQVAADGKSIILTGGVDPNGQSTTYQFEYGTSPGSYTHSVPVPAESVGSGTSFVLVSHELTGLPSTHHYYRISASNANGKAYGEEWSFGPPGVLFPSAKDVTRKDATVTAFIGHGGLPTTYQVEYGTTTAYGSKAPVSPKELPEEFSGEKISGLSANTLYHYRFVVENAMGVKYSNDKTFTTLPNVTLYPKGKPTPLEVGAPMGLFSSNFSIGSNVCEVTEFVGEVTENPGAMQSLAGTKMHNSGGAKCPYGSGLTAAYSIPTKGMTLEYTVDALGEPVARLSDFRLVGAVYFGAAKIADCEWGVEASAAYGLSSPLEVTLSGVATMVEGTSESCFFSRPVSGTFAVATAGTPVEVKP